MIYDPRHVAMALRADRPPPPVARTKLVPSEAFSNRSPAARHVELEAPTHHAQRVPQANAQRDSAVAAALLLLSPHSGSPKVPGMRLDVVAEPVFIPLNAAIAIRQAALGR